MDFEHASADPNRADVLSRMERDWDARAREAPEYYIATAHREWRTDEFFQSGETNVENEVLSDDYIARGNKDLSRMRILEIGCGAGRMTRALAASFGEVHAVDISAEMIAAAERNLSGLRNVFLYKNSGADLAAIPDQSCDCAFSYIVFQHIPDIGVIRNYVREVYRCLKPGAIFKFQVQGGTGVEGGPAEERGTWLGVPLSLADAQSLADDCGFDLRGASGEGSQYFWLWFSKPKLPWIPSPIRNVANRFLDRARNSFEKSVEVSFSPGSVRAGESYEVRLPKFARQVIDIGYALTAEQDAGPATGVVGRWCELDSDGKASIPVPAHHPAGTVRITRVRSRTNGGRWYRAEGAIQVTGRDATAG